MTPAEAVEYRDRMVDTINNHAVSVFSASFNTYTDFDRKRFYALILTVPRLPVVVWRSGLWTLATKGSGSAFVGAPFSLGEDLGNQLWLFEDADKTWEVKLTMPTTHPEVVEEVPSRMVGMIWMRHAWVGDRFDELRDEERRGPAVKLFFVIEADFAGNGQSITLPTLREGPWLLPGQPIEEVAAALPAAANAFLQTRLPSVHTESLDRGTRRRSVKKNGHEPVVRTVALRLREPVTRGPNAQEVEWSCQWMVGAHWRKNHWQPEKPIFVQPYLKGPADKPFKEPDTVVYDVRR